MLEQIVYTRCSPYRGLTRQGEIQGSDGFGYFSFTPGLFDQCSEADIAFLDCRITKKNGANDYDKIGLINSYELFLLPSGRHALSFEVARPQCQEPRKDGILHRGGNSIKQCLVGDFSRNASELIGSTIWDAYLHNDNYYYLDEAQMYKFPSIPQKDDRNCKQGLSDYEVDRFIQEDRLFLAQKGMSFLLHEMRKPVSERKVLLIKDLPSNVELWVRAMLRLFPSDIANNITFSTNMTLLNTDAESMLFYYMSKSGRFLKEGYSNADTIRQPYCMIVGYHPEDRLCESVRQTSNSSFYIIDGVERSTTIPGEYSCDRLFYKEAFREKDFSWFRTSVLGSLPGVSLSTAILDLYEASKYLIRQYNVAGWKYEHVLSCLSVLKTYGVFSDRQVNQVLFDKLARFIEANIEKDENNGFALSYLTREYGKAAGYKKPLSKPLADGIRKMMMDHRSADYRSIGEHLRNIQDKRFLSEIMEQLFADSRLQEFTNLYKYLTAQKVCMILDLFYSKLELCDKGMSSILLSEEKKDMVYFGIYAVHNDEKYAEYCLSKINEYPSLYCEVVSAIARNLEESAPTELAKWWKLVFTTSGKSIVQLCDELCRTQGTTLHTIEELICFRIREAKKYDEDDFRAYMNSKKILPYKAGGGKQLFSLIIDFMDPGDVFLIAKRIHEMKMGKEAERELFYKLDAKLGIPKSGMNSKTYNAMHEWERVTGFRSVYCACADLYDSINSARRKSEVFGALQQFINAKVPYRAVIEDSEWLSEIIHRVSELCDAKGHVLMLKLFLFPSKEKQWGYIRRYFRESLQQTGKKDQICLMESVCELFCDSGKETAEESGPDYAVVPGFTREEIKKAFTDALYEEFKYSMIKQAEKYSFQNWRAKRELYRILTDIENSKPKKGFSFPFNFF